MCGQRRSSLFFISSAFFLYQKERNVLSVYKSRFKSVLLPYLLWNMIYMLLFIVLGKLSLTNTVIETINVADILEGIFLYKYNYTYWFMFYLIIFIFLFPVIKLLIYKNRLVCFLSLIFLLVLNLFKVFPGDVTECFFYYYLGATLGFYFKEKVEKLTIAKTQHKLLTIFILIISVIALFATSKIYKTNTSFIQKTLMVLLVFLISSFEKIKFPTFLLGLSFMIYSMHPFILEVVEKIIFIFCPHNDIWALADYIVAPTISVCIIAGVCIVFKKILPSLYMILNGNRE